MIRKTALIALFTALLALTGCERDGPAENAGEAVDEAVDELRDGAEGTAEEAGEAIDEAVDGQQ